MRYQQGSKRVLHNRDRKAALSVISRARRTAVVVDQQPMWVERVVRVVSQADVEPAWATTSSTEARKALDELQPNLLVTDVCLGEGGRDGLDLICYARERNASLRAIVFTVYDDAEHIDAAFAAGALAYVLKRAHPDDLMVAIRQVFDKSMYLSSAPRAQVVTKSVAEDPGLTRRELEILRLVAEGQSNAEVGRSLWVTEQTVKFHLSNVFRKLDVANRTEASHWAQRHGLLSFDSALRVRVR